MRYYRRLLTFVVGMLAALVLAAPAVADPTPPPTTPPAQLCEISVTVPAQWTTGYIVNITVRNISNRPVTVYANVILQPPGFIVQSWNVTVTVTGSTAVIRPWNPVLLPGQTVTFGYIGTGPLALPTVYCQ
ncbi:cellulose binding domain-containing protein [Phytohabitans sp. LJ34]|uniref:cellulose binding domain-containing protein n=1 Tax=Phytohabitans sp. LJ34 TaxID=3452217 RepID=UPI003F8891B0